MIGSRLAHFEITAHLGSGGMGDVYQATDSKLGRSVAIKVLPDAFARDAERVARFEREARVLASLNHSNIAAIFGLEHDGGQSLLVMELVLGQTLAERINKGPVPVDEALEIAKQIAEALEAAHEKGVIHRDLKPANIKITPDGKVKVLDFGLAKAYTGEMPPTDASNSPTLLSSPSLPGVILGTAAYMSPEQAKGRTVDKRTDIFAFGSVLYEMLTGKRAFDGEDVTEILGAVVRMEPEWTQLPANVPAGVRNLLKLCLEKNLKNRRSSATDVRIDIELASKTAEAAVGEAQARQRAAVKNDRPYRVVLLLLMIAIITLAVPTVRYLRETPPPEMRLEITTPGAADEFALSPNGDYIAFIASGGGGRRLWLRPLDKTDAQSLPGTEDADFPFWSPDSRSIGFFAGTKLKRIDVAGGSPQVLANTVATLFGGAWNPEGTIVFASGAATPLSRVPASGGEPVALTRLSSGQNSHRYPQFLPDGRRFLFFVAGNPEVNGIHLGSLDGGVPRRLGPADSAAAYVEPDTLVFLRGTTLVAQHVDWKRGAFTGDPLTIADPVGNNNLGAGATSVSGSGLLAYRAASGSGLRQLTWYDRTGKRTGAAGEPSSNLQLYPELLPDGQRVVLTRVLQGNQDVWLLDLLRGGITRLTFDPAVDATPVSSPDGRQILFASTRKGPFNLYLKPSSGAGAEELLLETPNATYAKDWSKDGRFILYEEVDPKTGRDLRALPTTGNDRKPIPVVNTAFEELNGQFSPDGRWVAYETNESGRFEIVVQPFPTASGKWQVSTNGGIQPRWRSDGKELYFIAPDLTMMAASITTNGDSLMPGAPAALFPTHLAPGAGANKQQYAVSRDGRFLLNEAVEAATSTPITLLLNWHPQPVK